MAICILNTFELFEAQLAKAKLESNGIFCELRTNDAGGMLPHLRCVSGTQLYIAENDLEAAVSILK